MSKIFKSQQIQNIDDRIMEFYSQTTSELVDSVAQCLCSWILQRYFLINNSMFFESFLTENGNLKEVKQKYTVIAGLGNNGADGLSLALKLLDNDFPVSVYFVNPNGKSSSANRAMLWSLTEKYEQNVVLITDDVSELLCDGIVIDALFGTGLKRPLEGIYKAVVDKMNQSDSEVISIDMPSGLKSESNSGADEIIAVKASFTLAIEFPKLAHLMPANVEYVGELEVLSVGFNKYILNEVPSQYYFTSTFDAENILKHRPIFSHKGTFGHALIVSGHYGQSGAAILSGLGCLKSGSGLTTIHVPSKCVDLIQISIPEALTSIDESERIFTGVQEIDRYDSIAIGPGLGTKVNTVNGLSSVLKNYQKPMVIDADAINIIAEHPELLKDVPYHSIFTPHPKEFSRLIKAPVSNDIERLEQQINFSKENKCILVLKGAYTSISTPEGHIFFNLTGNTGLAKGGSGDFLTGLIVGLLCQGYKPIKAAVLGAYLHGAAADEAIVLGESEESLIPTNLATHIGKVFTRLKDTVK